VNLEMVAALSNPPLQRLNATPDRLKVSVCRNAAR
jgi:hypothetical protein